MMKRWTILTGLTIALIWLLLLSPSLFPTPAAAQSPGEGNWRGAYFNNAALSGEPSLVRDDIEIDFDWGLQSPAQSQINRNNFSVRWTQTIDLPPDLYRFTMTVDDGGRLWVDDRLLIDAWQVQSPRTYSEEVRLTGDSVSLRMEYFEEQGEALAQLRWQRVSQAVDNWQAAYFNNPTLEGDPILTRAEPKIDFNWGQSSPAPETVGVDRFSARWRRTVDLSAGTYCFVMTSDDGARLFVNGELQIDAWRVQAQETFTQKVDVPGGITALKMEYFEDTGEAVAQLNWVKVETPVPIGSRAGVTVITQQDSPQECRGLVIPIRDPGDS